MVTLDNVTFFTQFRGIPAFSVDLSPHPQSPATCTSQHVISQNNGNGYVVHWFELFHEDITMLSRSNLIKLQ